VGNVELSYPLIRRRRLNLNVAGGLDVVNQQTDQGGGQVGGGTLTKDNVRVAYVRADGDMRAYAFDRNFLLDGAVTVRKGLTGLGATRQGAALATRQFAAPDAWLVRAAAGISGLVAGPLSASLRAQAQYADKPLTPYEQISLGDLSVGRGYDPAVLLGDTGAAAAFDLRYAAVQLYPRVLASPFVFYDQGFVHNNQAGLSGLTSNRTLRSFGAGVTLRLANRANLELTYARPIDPVAAGGARPAPRLLVNLTASFF
jgi:hemolysin activation/secretion protein